jgi:hypothetical protein
VGLNQLDPKYLSLGNLLNADISSAAAQAAGIPLPYPGFRGSVAQALRPYPQFTNIPQANAMASSGLYHSLQLNLQKRFSQGLHFLVAYTISKNIVSDGRSGYGTGTGAGDSQHTDLRRFARFVSYDTDRPRILNLSWVYQLPFGPDQRFLNSTNPFLKQLVGGWQLSAIHNYGAGLPIRVLSSRGIPTAGGAWVLRNNDVPVRTGVSCSDYDPNDPNSRHINIAAFSDPAPFSFGNMRVLPDVRHCGYANEDVSILKRFPVRESIQIHFGADFFNIFNRHYWDSNTFAASLGSPATFGRYTAASAPRTIQFSLKVKF